MRPAPLASGSAPKSLIPFSILLGLFASVMLGKPASGSIRKTSPRQYFYVAIAMTCLLGVFAYTIGIVAGLFPDRPGVFRIAGALGCAIIGGFWWIPRPFPPWPKGTAPVFPDLRDLAPSTAFTRATRYCFIRCWTVLLGLLLFAFALGVEPGMMSASMMCLAVAAWIPQFLSGAGGKKLPEPRYLSSAIGLAFLSASLYLWIILIPALAPPIRFPFVMLLFSLILMITGIMLGALDRPLLSRSPATVAAKLFGSTACIFGFYLLLAGLDAVRYLPEEQHSSGQMESVHIWSYSFNTPPYSKTTAERLW
jgi:MFS family permease